MNEDPQNFLDEVYKIFYAIGVISNDKAELATYQLKDVTQTWYIQWNNKALRVGPISWEVFRREFLDRFFLREKREAKMEEFINLLQGGMSVQEYSLKFIKFSKYASPLVSNPRYEMNRFIMDVVEYVMR